MTRPYRHLTLTMDNAGLAARTSLPTSSLVLRSGAFVARSGISSAEDSAAVNVADLIGSAGWLRDPRFQDAPVGDDVMRRGQVTGELEGVQVLFDLPRAQGTKGTPNAHTYYRTSSSSAGADEGPLPDGRRSDHRRIREVEGLPADRAQGGRGDDDSERRNHLQHRAGVTEPAQQSPNSMNNPPSKTIG